MSNRIHVLNHPTIKFESMNPNQVKHYETALDGISDDDIRKAVSYTHLTLPTKA